MTWTVCERNLSNGFNSCINPNWTIPISQFDLLLLVFILTLIGLILILFSLNKRSQNKEGANK